MQDRLPKPPKVDLAKFDEEQKALAAIAPPINQFPRANATIAEIEAIDKKLWSGFQTEDYAEALAEVGRFKDAAKLKTPRSDYYQAIYRAIWLDDAKTCKCKPFESVIKVAVDHTNESLGLAEKEVKFDTWHVVKEVFSEKHGRLVPLRRCNNCDMWNASDETPANS